MNLPNWLTPFSTAVKKKLAVVFLGLLALFFLFDYDLFGLNTDFLGFFPFKTARLFGVLTVILALWLLDNNRGV